MVCGAGLSRPGATGRAGFARRRWKIWRRRCSEAAIGWFGPYLFLGCQDASGLGRAVACDGVAGILGNDPETRQAVAGALIQKALDDSLGHKQTHLRPFIEGQRVFIRRGAFADLSGIIVKLNNEDEAAMVRVDMLGKQHALELAFSDMRAA